MMKKLLPLILALSFAVPLAAAAQLNTTQGGTGTTSPSGILYGTTGILRLSTVTIGTGLQFVAGVLSAVGSGVTSVFGRTGAVIAQAGDYTTDLVTEATNLYYTNTRVNTFIAASTTIPKTYTANTFSAVQTFTNSPIFSSLGAGAVNSTAGGTLYNTGTSTPTVTSPINYTGILGSFIGGVSGAFTCTNASAGVTGCLTGTDWSTFNNKQPAGNYITALTGDVTASGPGSVAATLATVNGNVGSFTNANITVNAKGLITAAANGAASGGITTLGPAGQGQTGATQTLATTTNGTDFTITASGDVQSFNLPVASAVNTGKLSSTDWSTFNAKEAVLSFVYPLVRTINSIALAFGTTTSNTWAGTQTFTNSPVFSTLGAGTVNSTAAGTVYNTGTSTPTVTAPIQYSGTLGQFIGGVSGAISITQSGAATDGYLSSIDWNVFNNKISSTSLSGASVISYTSSTGVITTTGGTFGAGNYVFPTDLTVTSKLTATNASTTLFSTTYGSTTNAFLGTLTLSTTTAGCLQTASNGGVFAATCSGGGTPGGSNMNVQYNNAGSFGGSNKFSWNDSTNVLTLGTTNSTAFVVGPDATSVTHVGGSLELLGGLGSTTGDGGNIALRAGEGGTGTGGHGGEIVISGGQGGVNGEGGSLTFDAGSAGGGNRVGGSINVNAGAAAGTQEGGGIGFGAGTGGDTGLGGEIQFQGGSGGATSGNGGPITFTGGNADGSGDGGDVVFKAGQGNGGTNGKVRIEDASSGISSVLDTASLTSSDKTFTFPDESGNLCLNTGGSVGALSFYSTVNKITAATGLFWDSLRGTFGIGTTTPRWLAQFSTSTAPQLALTSSSATGNFHWVFNNIFGNLFLATSSATTFATSTSGPYQGYIMFGKDGGCIGCSDIVLPLGINLRNAKYINASSSNVVANTIQDVYTVPAGRRAVHIGTYMRSNAGGAVVMQGFVKSSGVYSRITASTSVTAGAFGDIRTLYVLEPGEGLSLLYNTSSGATTPTWSELIEYSSDTPFFSAKNTNITTATSTLYTATASARVLPNTIDGVITTAAATYMNLVGASPTFNFYKVNTGSTALVGINNTTPAAGAAGFSSDTVSNVTSNLTTANIPFLLLSAGDSIQFKSSAASAGSTLWINVYEH